MKKFIILLFCYLVLGGFGNFSFGLTGELLKNQILKSDTLKGDVLYNVYLPPNYDHTKQYPVIYYLHWFDADNNFANGFISIVDSFITAKKFPDVIVIAPNGKKTWYIDDWKGRCKYSTMFMSELVPYVKKKYSISPDKNKHVIMGLSMGGFGALRFSMLFPNEFGICASFMAGISTKEQILQDSDEDYKTYHQNLYGDSLKVSERVNKYFINNNPLYLASIVKPDDLKKTKWYIQACDNDYHSLANAELHCVFHKLNIPHEFRITNGEHDANCVDSSTVDALNFIKKSLQ